MKQANECGYNFEMPKSIIEFREVDTLLSLRTDQQWINEIRKLMKNAKIPEDECTIRVWGYTQKNRAGMEN